MSTVAHICKTSYVGGICRRVTVQASLYKSVRPYLKTKSSKGWRHGSSGGVPAQQMEGPEFKLRYCHKKMVIEKNVNKEIY
jgi:hypothetical protein